MTKGRFDVIDITDDIAKAVERIGEGDGVAMIFVMHTTCGLTIIEYEKGHMEDLKEMFEKIAPSGFDYRHHQRWDDRNGSGHLRGALLQPDLCVPISNYKLELGEWQRIVLIDFDEGPRDRKIIVKCIKAED